MNRLLKRAAAVGTLHIDSVSINCLRVLDRPNRTAFVWQPRAERNVNVHVLTPRAAHVDLSSHLPMPVKLFMWRIYDFKWGN